MNDKSIKSDKMLQEITKVSLQASRTQEPLLAYQDSVFAMRVDKGIQVYEFTYNLESLDKTLNLKSTWIQNPTASPAEGLFPEEFLTKEIKNNDMTEMYLDSGLWPHNRVLLQENSLVVAMEWSPRGIIRNNMCVLATLNNVGNIQFYGPRRFGWEIVLDLSSIIKQQFVTSKQYYIAKNLKQIKEQVYAVESSALAWGPKVAESCYFVHSQKNGDIMFWSIGNSDDVVNAQLIGTVSTDCMEIMTMSWLYKSDSSHILMCSNTFGQIFAYEFVFLKGKVEIVKSTCLWQHKDRMLPRFLLHTIVEDKIILICNKHRHLLVQALDKNCKVLSEVVNNVNDFKINDIKKCEDGFYLITSNCKLYKIKHSFVDSKLNVEVPLIETKDPYTNYEFHSFCRVSQTLLAVAITDQKLQIRKQADKIDLLFLTPDLDHKTEMQALLNNPTRKLSKYWPSIELIRLKTQKLKQIPQADYDKLFSFVYNGDLYNLKLYLALVIIHNRIDTIARNKTRGALPETSVQAVKEKIQALHASKVVSVLCEIEQNDGVLDDFDQEILVGSHKFLEYYSKKYDKKMSEFISNSLPKIDRQYTCQCCEELIEGFTCKNKHFNMFCASTFTPIQSDDYLICQRCGSTYRIELLRNNSMCLFCDVYLNNFTHPS